MNIDVTKVRSGLRELGAAIDSLHVKRSFIGGNHLPNRKNSVDPVHVSITAAIRHAKAAERLLRAGGIETTDVLKGIWGLEHTHFDLRHRNTVRTHAMTGISQSEPGPLILIPMDRFVSTLRRTENTLLLNEKSVIPS